MSQQSIQWFVEVVCERCWLCAVCKSQMYLAELRILWDKKCQEFTWSWHYSGLLWVGELRLFPPSQCAAGILSNPAIYVHATKSSIRASLFRESSKSD